MTYNPTEVQQQSLLKEKRPEMAGMEINKGEEERIRREEKDVGQKLAR
jgi:hypothetical protein